MIVAISILSAVVLGLGVYLLNRLDDLRKKVDEEVLPKISDLPDFKELNRVLGRVEENGTHLGKQIDDVDTRLKSLQEQVTGIARQLGPAASSRTTQLEGRYRAPVRCSYGP